MYSVLSLMMFKPLPRAYLHLSKVSSTCTLLSLHTTATATTTSSATENMVHGDSCLTSYVSLSITTANQKGIRANLIYSLYQKEWYSQNFYFFMPPNRRCRRHYVYGLSVRPSGCPSWFFRLRDNPVLLDGISSNLVRRSSWMWQLTD